MKESNNDFKMIAQADYCDDGTYLMKHKYVKQYLNLSGKEYKKCNIEINKKKSKMLFYNNNKEFVENKKQELNEYECDLGIAIARHR